MFIVCYVYFCCVNYLFEFIVLNSFRMWGNLSIICELFFFRCKLGYRSVFKSLEGCCRGKLEDYWEGLYYGNWL